MSKIREYEGKDISVRYDVKRCIHVAECVEGLPAVFDRHRKPWVDADGADADSVAAVVMRCPTGALQFTRKDRGQAESAPDANVAAVAADGPLYLHGDVEIVTGDGSLLLGDTRVALCRCGASDNKPFCDGRHEEVGFQHGGQLEGPKPKPEGFSPGGKLAVAPLKNGPVLVKGPLEVRSADGDQVSYHDAQVALCRCGGSQKKPFCDGSHKQIGFTAD